MDRTEISVRHMLTAIEAPLYDVGVLSNRGMLPGLDGIPAEAVLARLSLLKNRNARGSHIYIRPTGEHRYTALDDLAETSLANLTGDGFNPCAVVETSAGNFQAWLKHSVVFPKLLGTFAAQTLATRYHADPSAADWRRFGRLPGFTNCKPKYKRPDGLFPFVRLTGHSGEQYPMAEAFAQEITKLYQQREQEREAKRLQASLSPQRGPRLSNVTLERFRTSGKYRDRPAAADIAFCVAAYANGMTHDQIERALDDEYLSRDPNPSKKAAYIRRTMEKARRWAER
jgi:RepB DNA-primase from phage plasmid